MRRIFEKERLNYTITMLAQMDLRRGGL